MPPQPHHPEREAAPPATTPRQFELTIEPDAVLANLGRDTGREPRHERRAAARQALTSPPVSLLAGATSEEIDLALARHVHTVARYTYAPSGNHHVTAMLYSIEHGHVPDPSEQPFWDHAAADSDEWRKYAEDAINTLRTACREVLPDQPDPVAEACLDSAEIIALAVHDRVIANGDELPDHLNLRHDEEVRRVYLEYREHTADPALQELVRAYPFILPLHALDGSLREYPGPWDIPAYSRELPALADPARHVLDGFRAYPYTLHRHTGLRAPAEVDTPSRNWIARFRKTRLPLYRRTLHDGRGMQHLRQLASYVHAALALAAPSLPQSAAEWHNFAELVDASKTLPGAPEKSAARQIARWFNATPRPGAPDADTTVDALLAAGDCIQYILDTVKQHAEPERVEQLQHTVLGVMRNEIGTVGKAKRLAQRWDRHEGALHALQSQSGATTGSLSLRWPKLPKAALTALEGTQFHLESIASERALAALARELENCIDGLLGRCLANEPLHIVSIHAGGRTVGAASICQLRGPDGNHYALHDCKQARNQAPSAAMRDIVNRLIDQLNATPNALPPQEHERAEAIRQQARATLGDDPQRRREPDPEKTWSKLRQVVPALPALHAGSGNPS